MVGLVGLCVYGCGYFWLLRTGRQASRTLAYWMQGFLMQEMHEMTPHASGSLVRWLVDPGKVMHRWCWMDEHDR